MKVCYPRIRHRSSPPPRLSAAKKENNTGIKTKTNTKSLIPCLQKFNNCFIFTVFDFLFMERKIFRLSYFLIFFNLKMKKCHVQKSNPHISRKVQILIDLLEIYNVLFRLAQGHKYNGKY